MNRVVFRTDASISIGTGHVMRCLTLADALRQKGRQCLFICRAHDGNLIEQIRQQGFDVHALPITPVAAKAVRDVDETVLAHAAWLGTDWATDAKQTRAALGAGVVDWLIVDHYGLDVRWERQLRTACRHLMVIDDIADRQHDCDVLLDQNLNRHAADYAGLIPCGCTVFVGPKYALLRPEFAELRDYSIARRAISKFGHLLISMGGVDKDNATGRVLNALSACTLPASCRISVVMGVHAPWISAIRAQAAKMPAAEVFVGVQNMAKLMADSDLAIGAAGSSSWERCCLGLPTLMLVLADNQRQAAIAMEKAGAAVLINSGDSLESDLRLKVSMLKENLDVMQQLVENAQKITSGDGRMRLVRTVLEYR